MKKKKKGEKESQMLNNRLEIHKMEKRREGRKEREKSSYWFFSSKRWPADY